MSQPDLTSRLRAARPVAPPDLRERVRLIAAEATAPRRARITWRRAAVVLVPVAAAIIAAVVFVPSGQRQAGPVPVPIPPSPRVLHAAQGVTSNFAAAAAQAPLA